MRPFPLLGLLTLLCLVPSSGSSCQAADRSVDNAAELKSIEAEWTAMLSDPDASVRSKAIVALGELGPNAKSGLNALRGRLEDSDPLCRVHAATACWKIDGSLALTLPVLIDGRNAGDDKVRTAANESLLAIGAEAEPVLAWAVEQLRREQQFDEVRDKIVEALNKVGLAAVPVLLDASSIDYQAQRRSNANSYLGNQVPTRLRDVVSRLLAKQPDVLPIVLAMLRDERDAVRATAAATCAALGEKAKPALPALIRALYDPDGEVRQQALTAVVARSASEPTASEALCEVLRRHKDGTLRTMAILSLSKDATYQTEPVFAALRDMLSDPQADVRLSAAELLMRTGQHRPLAEQTILSECSAREHQHRQQALSTIRQHSLTDKAAALDIAIRRLDDNSFAVRLEAVEVLKSLNQVAATKPRLIEMLSDDEPRVRSRVASLLWDAGDHIRAMRVWLSILQSSNTSETYELQQQLQKLTNIPAEVEPLLIESTSSSNREARRIALDLLTRRPQLGEAAVSAIQKLTRDADPSVRASAFRALQTAKVPIDVQLKLLRETLDDADLGVRQQAVQRLGELGKAAQPASPKLLELLRDSKEPALLKSVIVAALSRMQLDRATLLPAFAPLLQETDSALVVMTLSSLGRMGPEAVPLVIPLADHKQPQIRQSALGTLLTLTSQHPEAVATSLPVIVKSMAEVAAPQRLALTMQMQRLGAACVKPLAAELRHPDVAVRRLAAEALRGIGRRGARQVEAELLSALDDTDPTVRLNAAVTLTQVAKLPPPRLTPILLEGLRDEDVAIRRVAVQIGASERSGDPQLRAELEKCLTHDDADVMAGAARCLLARQNFEPVEQHVRRLAAALGTSPTANAMIADVFTTLGPRAKAAIPELIEKLKTRGNSFEEQQFLYGQSPLVAIGEAAIPALRALAADDNERLQSQAVYALQGIKPQGLNALVELHGTVKPNVRNEILRLICSQLDQSPAALKLVLDQVASRDVGTSNIALSHMNIAPSVPREAVPTLIDLLKQARQAPAASVSRQRMTLVLQVLLRAGADAREALPELIPLLDGNVTEASESSTLAAAIVLSIDPSHADAALVFLKSLDSRETQATAMQALERIGLKIQPLLPQFERHIDSTTLPMRGRLLYLLAVCGSQSEKLVPAVEQLLDSPNATERTSAAQSLRWLGPRARPLLPTLLSRLSNSQDYTRYQIVQALPLIAPDHPEAVSSLIDFARNDPSAQWIAMAALSEMKGISPSTAQAVASLAQSLTTPQADSHILIAAMQVLLDPASRAEATSTLLEVFELQPSPRYYQPALFSGQITEALAIVGKDSEEIRSELRRRLTHLTPSLRVCAARALWKIEQQPDTILPVLLEALAATPVTAATPFGTDPLEEIARTLGEIGPPAKAAVPQLLRKIHGAPIEQQAALVAAVRRLDPEAAKQAGYLSREGD